MNTKPLSHDRLQQECFNYLWNNYPETHYCCFHAKNESRPVSKEILIYFLKFCKLFIAESIIDAFIKHFYSCDLRKRELAYYKAIGVLPGVWDLIWYHKGALIGFDIKIGADLLSENQKSFAKAIESQGGKCFVISDKETFCNIVKEIIEDGSRKTE